MMLPTYIEMITAQNTSGFCWNSRGPGWTPYEISAPSITAVVPDPGIPSVSSGTKEPVQAALLAVSGAARPRMEPFPNCRFASAGAKFRSAP